MSRRIQAVLFDAAGTLIRLREPVGETYAREAKAFGVDVPAGRVDEAFHRVFAAAPANVHPGTPLAEAATLERDWWQERVRETFRAADQMVRFDDFDGYFERLWVHFGTTDAWALAPGTEAALDALQAQGLLLAVLSNFDQRLRALLVALGIHERFEAVTLPADAGAAKPNRQIFDACLKRLGLAGQHTVYVGDDAVKDVAASKAAGMRAIDVAGLATLEALPAAVQRLEDAAP